MTYFTKEELESLNTLQFNETEHPYFDPIRYSLRWLDEEPQNIDGEAYEHLLDLVIVRGWIHRGRAKKDWHVVEPTVYFAEVWEEAMRGAPDWPGFKRIDLSSEDRAYLEKELAKPPEEHF